MSDRETALERAGDTGALVADGFDEAIIGTARNLITGMELVVYDEAKVIGILMDRDDMALHDAQDYYEVNVAGGWHGEGTPIFVDLFDD
jgi:hypothetical protein